MQFSPVLNLGDLIMTITFIACVIGGYYALKTRVDEMSLALASLGHRMNKSEEVIFELSGHVQKAIGQIEIHILNSKG